jgi:cyclopropane fatty-acyl-phospholipid synthase-like methyltransferase
MKENKDWFAEKANDYDADADRTQNVVNIAQGILNEISFSKNMKIMDFGSGTGLLLAQIAPYVGKITAVDISKSMNAVLQSKKVDCDLEMLEMDLTKEDLEDTFDAVISSMTFHHIDDVQGLFDKLYTLLNDKGSIAIADLDKEDGSFHSTDTGVFHLGFERADFINFAQKAGFRNVKIKTVSLIKKPTGNYPIFLLTAEK